MTENQNQTDKKNGKDRCIVDPDVGVIRHRLKIMVINIVKKLDDNLETYFAELEIYKKLNGNSRTEKYSSGR